MKHEEGFFKGSDGLGLYYQHWLTEAEPRASIALVHGFGEHSGRYMNVVNALTPSGYTIYGYDHRGHGRSPGQRVYIKHWGEYREDLRAFLDMIHQQQVGIPLFLYGQSMGGLIALDYILHYPQGLRGAIICSSLIVPPSKPHLVLLARVLSGFLPRLTVNVGLDLKGLSRDQQVVKACEADPLFSNVGTVRWGTEMLNTVSWVKSHAKEISLPILLIHGDADRLNRVEGSRYLFDAITYPEKTLIIYPGGYHELHNDIDHEQVLADIKNWLDRYL